MRKYFPAKWRTADQYVRTFNGTTVSPVIDTLSEVIVMHDPFQCPDLHGNTRNLNAAFIATTLRIHGF